MLEINVDVILKHLEPNASVLDVGGWYVPFNRADSVVDLMPYETRGSGQGPGPKGLTQRAGFSSMCVESPYCSRTSHSTSPSARTPSKKSGIHSSCARSSTGWRGGLHRNPLACR
jgi:hypothetical protein